MTAAAVLAQAGMWLAAFVVGGLIGQALRRAIRRRAIRRRPVWTDDVVVNGRRVGTVRVEGRVSAEEAQRIGKAFIAANISRPDLIDLVLAGHLLADMCKRFGVDVNDVESMSVRPHSGRRGEWDITVTLQTDGAPFQRGFTVPVPPSRSAS